MVCACLYKVWVARNLVVFQEKLCCPIVVAGGVYDCVQEFDRLNPEYGKRKKAAVVRPHETFPLDVHFAQVDAGFSVEGDIVFRCVFKNHSNGVLMAASKKDQIEVNASLT